MNTGELLEKYFDVAFAATDGIKKLRELILSLAMQGKLVPQDGDDRPASKLLKEIDRAKEQFLLKNKVKYKKISENADIKSMQYHIPISWLWLRFQDVAFFQEGPGIRNWQFTNQGIKLLNVSNILSNGNLDFSNSDKYVSLDEFLEKYTHFEIQEGDLLFASSGGSWGKIAWYKPPSFRVMLNTSTIRLRFFDNRFEQNYLYYFLKTAFFKQQMEIQLVGMQPNFGSTHLSRIYIPIPPLAEQCRIVAKIDELMARCDELEKLKIERDRKQITVHKAALNRLLTAKDHSDFQTSWHFITQHFGELYSVKENVAELRKAILQLAVMGKLVPQDPSDQPASELLKEIEKEKQLLINEKKIKQPKLLPEIKPEEFPYKLPKSWQWSNIQSVSLKVTDGEHITPQRSGSGYYLLSARNVTNEGIKLDDVDHVPQQEYERIRKRCDPEIGDILISCSGSVGRIAIVDANDYVMVRSVALIKHEHNFLKSSFLANVLKSPIVQSQIVEKSRTTAQSNLFLGKINEIVDLLQIKFEQPLDSIHSCTKQQLNYNVIHNDDDDCDIVQLEF